MNSKTRKSTRSKKKPLKRPQLRKLGSLSKLTRGMNGVLADGASGMTKA